MLLYPFPFPMGVYRMKWKLKHWMMKGLQSGDTVTAAAIFGRGLGYFADTVGMRAACKSLKCVQLFQKNNSSSYLFMYLLQSLLLGLLAVCNAN